MKIGVIGSGAISDIYLTNMINVFDNIDVECIASMDREQAKEKAKQHGIRSCTPEELLKDPQVEMVVNLTPVGAHYQVVRDSLMAGKHVYTEKTMTDDLAKAAELVKLADEKGLYLGSAPDTFLGSGLQTARRAVDNGLIGDVHSFVISCNRKNDILLSAISFLRQPGCGILYDYGVYYVTALVSILGPVSRVAGVIGKPYPTHVNILTVSPEYGKIMDTPNESQVSAILQLENGITGTMHIDADNNILDTAFFAIYGTKGILYLTDPNQFGGSVKYLTDDMNPTKKVDPVELWSYTQYSENFRGIGPSELANAIREGRECRPSKEMAYHVLEVLTAILNGGEKGEFFDIESTCRKPDPLPLKNIGVKNLAHISINMKNVDAMIDFYENVLGLKEQFSLTYSGLQESLKQALIQIKETGSDPNNIAQAERYLQVLEAKGDGNWLTYFALADRQFIELFYPDEHMVRSVDDRKAQYGFTKYNLEVESIEEIRERLVSHGVTLDEDIHPTLDGAKEIIIHDPDGNELQFTEYPREGGFLPPMAEIPKGHSRSAVQYITQVAYQVKDAPNMENFYCLGLGFKKAGTLHYGELVEALEKSGQADPQMIMGLKISADKPWLDYIEIAPHQYIELFHTDGQDLKEDRDLSDAYGFQHICIEVEDIHKAWDAVTSNGIKPDTEIALGPDGAYQFWLTDPDGNRLELMEYTDKALQLQ